MRKDDYIIEDLSQAKELYDEMIGRAGIITTDNFPRIIPVNFVNFNGKIYFHGATEGEKYELFLKTPPVTFQIEKVYSYIPSDWFDSASGCNATICYKSLYMKGHGYIVSDGREKSQALQALMEKHQDIESFDPFTFEEPRYRRAVEETAIFAVIPEQTDLKFKFAQNHSVKIRQKLIAKLRERGSPTDIATADEIEKTLAS